MTRMAKCDTTRFFRVGPFLLRCPVATSLMWVVWGAGRGEDVVWVCKAGGERLKRKWWVRREGMCRNDPKEGNVFPLRDPGGDLSRMMGSSALLAGLCSFLSGGSGGDSFNIRGIHLNIETFALVYSNGHSPLIWQQGRCCVSYTRALNGFRLQSTKWHCYRVSVQSSMDISALVLNAFRSQKKSSHGAQHLANLLCQGNFGDCQLLEKISLHWALGFAWVPELPCLRRPWISLRSVAVCCVGIFGGGETALRQQSLATRYPLSPSPA